MAVTRSMRYRWATAPATTGTTTTTASTAVPVSDTTNGVSTTTTTDTDTRDASTQPAPPRADQNKLHWRDFGKRTPWVLVPNGSFNGYFDYVPLKWRIGPWTITARLYLLAIVCGAVVVTPFYLLRSTSSDPISSSQRNTSYLQSLVAVRYDDDISPMRLNPRHSFYYNAAASLWMVGSALHLYHTSPLHLKIWATYTVQSWTMLTVRHVLSALAYLRPASYIVVALAELARFPAACSATITFGVWNFAVMPFIYAVMSTPEKRRAFVAFCFSPRLLNIHLLNIVLAVTNGVYASPPRPLVSWDLYLAFVSVVLYMAFYLLVLDRIGVHLYAVFSPRAPSLVVVSTWTLLLALYMATFAAWRRAMMMPTPTAQ